MEEKEEEERKQNCPSLELQINQAVNKGGTMPDPLALPSLPHPNPTQANQSFVTCSLEYVLPRHAFGVGSVRSESLEMLSPSDVLEPLEPATPEPPKPAVVIKLSEEELQDDANPHSFAAELVSTSLEPNQDATSIPHVPNNQIAVILEPNTVAANLDSPLANEQVTSPKESFQKPMTSYELDGKRQGKEPVNQLSSRSVLNMASHLDSPGQLNDGAKSVVGDDEPIIKIVREDYDKLPSYLRNLASWEDLEESIRKTNSELCKRGNQKEVNLFSQEEFSSMALGKSHLLLLVRMNRLVLEMSNGAVVYRIVGL